MHPPLSIYFARVYGMVGWCGIWVLGMMVWDVNLFSSRRIEMIYRVYKTEYKCPRFGQDDLHAEGAFLPAFGLLTLGKAEKRLVWRGISPV